MGSYNLLWPGLWNVPSFIVDPDTKKVYSKDVPLPPHKLYLDCLEHKYVKLSAVLALFSSQMRQETEWILRDLQQNFDVRTVIHVTRSTPVDGGPPRREVTTYLPAVTLLALILIWPSCRGFQVAKKAVMDYLDNYPESVCLDCGYVQRDCKCDPNSAALRSQTTFMGHATTLKEKGIQTDPDHVKPGVAANVNLAPQAGISVLLPPGVKLQPGMRLPISLPQGMVNPVYYSGVPPVTYTTPAFNFSEIHCDGQGINQPSALPMLATCTAQVNNNFFLPQFGAPNQATSVMLPPIQPLTLAPMSGDYYFYRPPGTTMANPSVDMRSVLLPTTVSSMQCGQWSQGKFPDFNLVQPGAPTTTINYIRPIAASSFNTCSNPASQSAGVVPSVVYRISQTGEVVQHIAGKKRKSDDDPSQTDTSGIVKSISTQTTAKSFIKKLKIKEFVKKLKQKDGNLTPSGKLSLLNFNKSLESEPDGITNNSDDDQDLSATPAKPSLLMRIRKESLGEASDANQTTVILETSPVGSKEEQEAKKPAPMWRLLDDDSDEERDATIISSKSGRADGSIDNKTDTPPVSLSKECVDDTVTATLDKVELQNNEEAVTSKTAASNTTPDGGKCQHMEDVIESGKDESGEPLHIDVKLPSDVDTSQDVNLGQGDVDMPLAEPGEGGGGTGVPARINASEVSSNIVENSLKDANNATVCSKNTEQTSSETEVVTSPTTDDLIKIHTFDVFDEPGDLVIDEGAAEKQVDEQSAKCHPDSLLIEEMMVPVSNTQSKIDPPLRERQNTKSIENSLEAMDSIDECRENSHISTAEVKDAEQPMEANDSDKPKRKIDENLGKVADFHNITNDLMDGESKTPTTESNSAQEPASSKPTRKTIYGKFEYTPTREHIFRCLIVKCSQSFDTRHAAEMHSLVHSADEDVTVLQCHKCDFTAPFYHWFDLLRHLRATHDVHVTRESHGCEYCGLVFESSDKLMAHIDFHYSNRYKCVHCGLLLLTWAQVNRHLETCADKHRGNINLGCPYCMFVFHKKTIRNLHLLSHTDAGLACALCQDDVVWTDWKTLRKHYQQRHAKVLAMKVSPFRADLPVKRRMRCQRSGCDVEFKSVELYVNHMCRVHELVPYVLVMCSQCDKKFRTEKSRDWHVKQAHRAEIACEKCDFVATSKVTLK